MKKAFELFGEIALRGGEKVQRQLDGIDGRADGTGATLGKFGRSIARVGTAAATAAAVGLSALSGAVVTLGISHNAAMEQSEIAWKTLLGSGEAAKTMLQDLQTMGAKTPFEFEGLDNSAKILKAMGIDAANLLPYMESLGDAVAAVGGDGYVLEGVATAIGQMFAKGKIQAEEMMQLVERKMPVWDILSEKTGESVENLMKMASDGELLASKYVPMLVEGMGERFSGAMDEQSRSMLGMVSTAKDLSKMISGELTESLFANLKPIMEDVNAFLERLYAATQDKTIGQFFLNLVPPEVIDTFERIKTGIQPIVDYFSGLIMPFFKQTIEEIRVFWDENGAQIMQALQNFAAFCVATFNFFLPVIKFVVETVFNSIKGIISGVLTFIQGLILLFSGIFTGDFSMMWEGIKKIFFGAIETVWNWLNLLFVGRILSIIKNLATGALRGIVGMWKNITGAVTKGVGNVLKWIRDLLNKGIDTFNLLQRNGMSIWRSFTSAVYTIVQGWRAKIVQIASRIYTEITKRFNNILSTGKKIFNGIKNAITNPIQTAKNTILGIIDTIKRKFNGLRIQLPHIKMPKFHIRNWSLNPKNWLKNPPSLGVTWHQQGGFFDRPTVAGLGENGREMIVPIQNKKYMRPFSNAIADDLINLLGGRGLGAADGGRLEVPLVVNGREIARAIVNDIDRALYKRRQDKFM